MAKDLIKLQNANMFQETKEGTKSDWRIRENVTGDTLVTLPANISDQAMFQIMHFARKYELEAFNAGINFAKAQNLKGFDPESPFKTLDLKLVKEG